jgi:tetratricopeptide (TPR) repeat protein
MECFNAAAQVPTTRQTALNNMGNLLFMGGSSKKAIEAYTRANAAGNKNETVLYNLAMAYYGRKDLKKAIRYFGQMLELSPDRIDILLVSSSICVTLKRYNEAERYFLKIIELMPDHENAVRGLAAILIREKRYKEALQPVEAFLERQPLHKGFMALAADLYLKMGWHEVALMRFRTMMREFPDDAAGYKGAGECLYTLINTKGSPEFDNAISALKRASELVPRDPLPDYYIGNIYADNKGYRELAVEHWKKALARDPDKRTRKMIEKRMSEN